MELISKMAADPKSRQASNFNVRTLTGKIFLWQSGSYSGILGKTNHSNHTPITDLHFFMLFQNSIITVIVHVSFGGANYENMYLNS